MVPEEPLDKSISSISIKENNLFEDLDIKEELSDMDESEAQKFLLSMDESNQKKILWNSMYGDWLEEKTKINQKKALHA